eukprot:gnl/TRDRNA2_/TRDRNA2_35594_c0_seq1.p1 gnl/TRDRNA2_/TRDRNA2_35594_c0~~gnl/TRDRNA2_/TRDRNA2_35594_c0_seq1.p1  ORF type:complete len:221 (+),score=54.11 gnl/TRDRNA2_/TRDRNA2_35594_c0_seq1:99-761(+)
MGNTTPMCTGCCRDVNKRSPTVQAMGEEVYGPNSVGAYGTAGVPLPAGSMRPPIATNCKAENETASACDVETESAAATESTSASSTPDISQVNGAQQVVKAFVRSFVKGRNLRVLSTNKDGGTTCTAFLDRQLTTFALQRSGKKDAKKRCIPLENICEISVGAEAAEDVELPLDEFCVTLFLEDGQAIGFRFEDNEERDTFALCLSMFVDGRRGEVKRKS